MYGLPDSWAGYAIKKSVRYGRRSPGVRGGTRAAVRLANKSLSLNLSYSKIVIYKPILNFELNSMSGGMMHDYMHDLGTKIVAGAKMQVGVRTGALRRSIHMRLLGNRTGQYLWISARRDYAYDHHEGTRPHIITPSTPNGVLVFKSGVKVVRTSVVRHPGTKPNRYLTDQLKIHVR